MEFEWDDQNIAKHSVSFEYAARVFLDPHRLDREDNRRDYSEHRRLTLGKIGDRLFAVAYTTRGKTTRMISARKANDRERSQYDQTLSA